MNKELNIISENISYIKQREKGDTAARNLWLSRLIRLGKENGISSYSGTAQLLKDADAFSVDDILTVASELCKENPGDIHSDLSVDLREPKPYIVSNFKNSLSVQTYSHFFADKEFRIIERENFIDLFEDVYGERSNYCIVPIENTSSGKLSNFYSLITNYNLKILKVCDIEHSSQDASTRFALLSSAPINLTALGIKEYFFEVSISSKSESSLTRTLEAADKCRLFPKRIDSVPFTHLKGEYSYQIVFRMPTDVAFFEFLIFLSIEGISFTPIGIFE